MAFKDYLKIVTSPGEAVEAFKFRRHFQNAVANGKSIKKAKKITQEIVNKFEGLQAADISKWRAAYGIALSDEKNRYELYNIYKDTLLNDHLKSVIKVRLEKVLKNEFLIVDKESEEVEQSLLELFSKSWFWSFLTEAWKSRLYGFSLIEFGDLIESKEKNISFEFSSISSVPRGFVRPEFNMVVKEPYDTKGIDYTKPPFSYWVLEVGDKNDLGLLLEATPLAISNKYMGIFWDEFAELFAAPIRIGKTNTGNDEEVSKISSALADMGRNAWGVFDQGTDIQIVETQKKDAYLVYDKRMDRNNKGMSKLILGTTMTTEDGASLSQSQVHAEVTQDIVDSDKRFLQFVINEQLFPFLIYHGYPLDGYKFKWDESETLDIKDQAEIDKWLIDYFDIDIEYFRKKYNASIVDFKSAASDGGAAVGK